MSKGNTYEILVVDAIEFKFKVNQLNFWLLINDLIQIQLELIQSKLIQLKLMSKDNTYEILVVDVI